VQYWTSKNQLGPRKALPPDENIDYDHPKPVDCIPPIGHDWLLHRYRHPHKAYMQILCNRRLPKHRRHAIPYTFQDLAGKGWGIELVEGFDPSVLWYFAAMSIMCSTIFGIAWSAVKRDVSAGFTISSFGVNIVMVVIALGTAGTAIERLV
jgi:hypothetical protein